jgi:hypothetical protein
MSNYLPNFAPGERAGGEYHGNPITAVLGGTVGMQPQGANNPLGQIPGIAVMSINAETLETLSGPQPG